MSRFHIRPEAFPGTLWPLVISPASTRALGFANRCTWAHVVDATAAVTGRDSGGLLTQNELDALSRLLTAGHGCPARKLNA